MESVGARKRGRTEAGISYDRRLKKSRSLSDLPSKSRGMKCKEESVANSCEKTESDQYRVIPVGPAVDGSPHQNDDVSNAMVPSGVVFGPIVSDSTPKILPELLGVEGQTNLYTNYSLNEKTALVKKRKACNRENYTMERKSFSDRITFSTTAFKVFRRCFEQYYLSHRDKFLIEITPVLDRGQNVVQDIVRVSDPNKRNTPLIYTVNIYRTTSRLMVNGPHHMKFTDVDLPMITCLISQEDEKISECNQVLQEQLS